MKNLLKKVISIILLTCMISANMLPTITYALSENEIANQNTQTQNSNVEFNAYFEGKQHTKTEKINNQATIYLDIKVSGTGYLEKGVITFENTNFTISEQISNKNIQSIDTKNNKIILNKINGGSNEIIEIPVKILSSNEVSTDNFAKEIKTVFTATYIDKKAKENNVSKEIINKLSWDGITENTVETQVATELTKYIPYSNNQNVGVLVQAKINSAIKNSILPIQQTNIELQVPELNNIKPNSATVIANNTSATNGENNGLNFNNQNYTYNSETGILTINTQNQQNKILWLKNTSDEYLATFIFEGEQAYNYVIENGLNTEIKVNGNIQVYSVQPTQIQIPETTTQLTATEQIGELVDYNLTTTESIAKGQIYANYQATNKKETTYNVEYSATIANANLTNNITFKQNIDQFITANNTKNSTTVAGNNYTYNKNITVSQKVFEKILGTEGTIEIYNTSNEKIATIDKNTNVKNEKYILNIEELNNNQLTIITSKPVSEGTLDITIEKAIKTEIDYTSEQLQTFNKISTTLNNITKQIELTEPQNAVTVEINKTDLTTAVENENVEIRTILNTSSTENALYKNPTLNITLPENIAKLKINSYDILMANGLKIKSVKPVEENGKAIIKIQLEGTQTEYTLNAQYKGTIIILNTNITLDTLAASGENKLTVNYTNASETVAKSSGTVETTVNYVAPQGIIAANGIANYAKGESDILSISNEGATAQINAYTQKTEATITGKIVNNYSNNVKNITVLGRIPSKDNTEIETGKNLNSTFSATMSSNVQIKQLQNTQYTVYYSENANATNSLNSTENNWTTNITENTKSYLIVLNNYEMKSGETIEFSYNIEIPENLTFNNQSSQLYKVYYTNESSIGEMSETKTSPVVTLATGEGPDLAVGINTTTSTVRTGQIVRFTATVKNTGGIEATNVKLNITAPKGTTHTFIQDKENFYTSSDETTRTISIGTIAAGEEKNIDFELKVSNSEFNFEDENSQQSIQIEANVTADVIVDSIQAQPYTINVQKGSIEIINTPNILESELLRKERNIKFVYEIRNAAYKKHLENVTFNMQIPEGINIKNVYYSDSVLAEDAKTDNVTINNNNITVNVGKLENITLYNEEHNGFEGVRNSTYVFVELNVESFIGEFTAVATATADGEQVHTSNIKKYTAKQTKLEINQGTPSTKYVKEAEEVTVTYTIKNIGEAASYKNEFTVEIPEGLSFVEATYTKNGEKNTVTTVNNAQKLEIMLYELAAEESVTISVTLKADVLPNKNDKTVSVYGTLQADEFEKTESNKVSITIEYNSNAHFSNDIEDSNDENNGNNQTGETYKITGTAWLDANQNGQLDETEELLQNIQAILLDIKTNDIVKDSTTNQNKITTTDSNGKYEFSNLKPGKYQVVFVYDNSKYSLTEYKKQNVDESLNSDVIDILITLNGEQTVVGMSDTLQITNSNIRDINIGVYVSEKFDLRLDKYITTITRTTPTSGIDTFNYANEKTTKIEVLKQNLGKSSIVIEYKIVVTNQGQVPGYVKKIVDYLPEGVSFKTELNSDWYLSNDGNAYNASLENTIINPGESKEVTLVLLKQITENSLGILNNNAEIYEAYNEKGLKDIDSTPANKVEVEDDMSKADIVLGVVTGGQIATYVAISVAVVAILVFGIIEIKKRVLNKK